MALIHRHNMAESNMFFKVASSNRKLIVGLGNVGKEYNDTRHNIGFACLDSFAKESEFEPWAEKKDWKCFFTKKNFGDTEIILIKPTTYMNLSGEAVQSVTNFYKISPENIIVVHDDLDIDFGQIRTRVGGSDAGNKGIRSINNHIGEEYRRIRIGVGKNNIPAEAYVLQKFNDEESAKLYLLIREVNSILSECIYKDLRQETRNFLI